MKIRDILKMLNEGITAYHITKKQFDKFDVKYNTRDIYGKGIYFEYTGRDENWTDYAGPDFRDCTRPAAGVQQIKAYLDLDMNKNLLDYNKTLASQNLKLDKSDVLYIIQHNKMPGGRQDDMSFGYNLTHLTKPPKNKSELSEYFYTIVRDINYLINEYNITKNNKKISLEQLLPKDVLAVLKPHLKNGLPRSGKIKFWIPELPSMYKKLKEIWFSIIVYIINYKLTCHDTLIPGDFANDLMRKKYPRLKGLICNALSSIGTEEERAKRIAKGENVYHPYSRRYIVIWDESCIHISGRRKNIKHKFDDEYEDEAIDHQLNYMQ